MGPGDGRVRAVWLHLRFTGILMGVAAALAAVGYLPTLERGGVAGIQAMAWAAGLNVLASSIAAVPITRAGLRPRRERLVGVLLGSLALRLTLVLALAGAVLVAGGVARRPFLLWVGLFYLALLPVDTRYAQRHARSF